jgi:hypothetical protein
LGRWIRLSEHGTASLMDGLTFGVKGGDMGATLVRAELLPLMQDMLDEQIPGRMDTNVQVFSDLGLRLRKSRRWLWSCLPLKRCAAGSAPTGNGWNWRLRWCSCRLFCWPGAGYGSSGALGTGSAPFGRAVPADFPGDFRATGGDGAVVDCALPTAAHGCALRRRGCLVRDHRAPGSAERPAEKG